MQRIIEKNVLTFWFVRRTQESFISVSTAGRRLRSSHFLALPFTGFTLDKSSLLSWTSSGMSMSICCSRIVTSFLCGSSASKSHTGVYLASRVSECLHEYGIEDKVPFLTFLSLIPELKSLLHT